MRYINKNLFCVLAILGIAFVNPFIMGSRAYAASEGIAIVVNDGAVSTSDLNDRTTLIVRSSGLPDTPEMREKVEPQVLTALVEEELKLQEAKRLKIDVTQEEIDNGFAQIAQQNNFSADQFRSMVKGSGINVATMFRQIRSQIAWGKVVQSQIRPQVKVNEADVNAALERLRANMGKTEYRVAEIFLPIDDPKEAASAQQLASRLTAQIKSGQAPFPKVAQQFSKSAGVSKGGDLGWVQEGQIDPAVEKALQTMKVQTVSDPVKSISGYHILLLIGKRQITEESMPSADDILNQIGMERLDRLQRKYLLDLKANAFIENRV